MLTGMPADFVVTHLASHLSGGAGVALARGHLALRQAGVDSRVLLGRPADASVPGTAHCVADRPGLTERIARRFGIELDAEENMRRAVETARPAKALRGGLELFSPPYSRVHPENHPWIAASSVLNIHWVAGFLDWPAFFAASRRPAVFTLHDQQTYLGGVHYEADSAANPWLSSLESKARETKRRAIASLSAAVIGNSRWNTRAAEASGFFPVGTTFHTVYYALDTRVYSPRPKPESKVALGLPAEGSVIGFASDDLGNRRKGFDVLMGAIRDLPASSNASLLSFGRAPSSELAASVPLSWQHLGFLDADRMKAAAYSAMDVFVVPSRAEAFGQTAIEAMACGTPVIVSDTGGLREAVDEGRCGLLVPPDHPGHLRDAITALLGAPDRRRALADTARAHVVDRHDPARHARDSLDVYRALLARQREANPGPS